MKLKPGQTYRITRYRLSYELAYARSARSPKSKRLYHFFYLNSATHTWAIAADEMEFV